MERIGFRRPLMPTLGRSLGLTMLWVRTAMFLVVLPGTLLFYLPLWLARTPTSFAPLGPLRFLGLSCLLVGSAALLWCMRDFVVRGRGTPAPIDPPRELVVQGLNA